MTLRLESRAERTRIIGSRRFVEQRAGVLIGGERPRLLTGWPEHGARPGGNNKNTQLRTSITSKHCTAPRWESTGRTAITVWMLGGAQGRHRGSSCLHQQREPAMGTRADGRALSFISEAAGCSVVVARISWRHACGISVVPRILVMRRMQPSQRLEFRIFFASMIVAFSGPPSQGPVCVHSIDGELTRRVVGSLPRAV